MIQEISGKPITLAIAVLAMPIGLLSAQTEGYSETENNLQTFEILERPVSVNYEEILLSEVLEDLQFEILLLYYQKNAFHRDPGLIVVFTFRHLSYREGELLPPTTKIRGNDPLQRLNI